MSGRARITIEDVAAQAGVSVATVSRALRGLPNVAPSTRQRVTEVAASLGYRPDAAAARLASGRSTTVGVAVPVLGPWYFAQVVAGVEAVLAEAGFDLLLGAVENQEARRRFVLDATPFQRRVDGFILVDMSMPDDTVLLVDGRRPPIVTIGSHHRHLDAVVVDNHAASHAATTHLLELGHRRIALLSGSDESPHAFTVPPARRDGYRAALADAGVDVDPDLDVNGDFSVEGAEEATAQLLDRPHPPTAIVAMSDEMAIGAVAVIRRRGLRVPEDVSVIGFDDHDLAEVFGLTTMRQRVVSHGQVAARLLLDRIADRGAPVRHEVLPVHLVERSTTGAVNPGSP